MQPSYAPTITVNNFSAAKLKERDEWAKEQNIKADEMLFFREISNGTPNKLKIKSVLKAAQEMDFEEVKTTNESFCIPNHESLIDRDAPGGFVQMVYYKGGYFPGKVKEPVRLAGNADETVITVIPQDDPPLYDFLTMTPRLKGGINSARITPQIELLRPDMEVEANWEDDQKQAEVILKIGVATMDVLKWMAPKLLLPANVTTEQRMRKNFADFAKLSKQNAEKLDTLFDADETKLYQHIEKAIAADVVAVDRDKQMWVMGSTGDVITPASNDRNTLDQLVGFLMMEDGQRTYKQILALTEKAGVTKRAPGRPVTAS